MFTPDFLPHSQNSQANKMKKENLLKITYIVFKISIRVLNHGRYKCSYHIKNT